MPVRLIYNDEDLDWQNLELNIYFSVVPTVDQKKELRRIVKSWCILGAYGGLGIKSLVITKITLKEKLAGLVINTDTSGEQAIKILMRTLVGYDEKENIIEKITLGVKREK